MLHTYSKFLDGLVKVMKLLILVASIVMLACMAYQVVMRYFFHKGNAWSEELARLMCIWVVMLGASIATRTYSHLQIDVFINLVPERTRHLVTAILTLVAAIFVAIMLKYSIDLCIGSKSASSAGLKLSKMYVYACIPVGFITMLLTSLEVIWKNIADFIHFEGKEGNA